MKTITATTTNATNPRRAKREKRKWIPQVKSLLAILSFFSLSLYRVLFFSSLGFVVVARSKALLFFFFFFFPPYNDILLRICARFYYNSAIRPTNQLFSRLAHFHPWNREREGKKERKNMGKKLRVRAISSKNVVIVVCSQVTMDCQEKPESNTKKRQKRKKKRRRREGLISYLRKWRERERGEKKSKG